MSEYDTAPPRPLYETGNPAGYQQAAGGRPEPSSTKPYDVVRLTGQVKHRPRVLLFTLENYPEPGQEYEGTIPDPLPAKHYAQLLLDMVEHGQVYAEAIMINNVMGHDNLKALASADDLDPEDLKTVMAEAYTRAMGPYKAGLGNAKSA
jgi:hypothetical protein